MEQLKNKVGRLALQGMKTYYKLPTIGTMEQNRTFQSIHKWTPDESGTAEQWEEDGLSNKQI